MRLRFTTSLPGLIEGRVIEVDDHNLGPDVQEWLRTGVLVPVPSLVEVAVAPDAPEYTEAPRSFRPRRRPYRPAPLAR